MATSSKSDPKDLVTLAERMGIPADEAIRQVAQLMADEHLPAPAIKRAEPVAVASRVA